MHLNQLRYFASVARYRSFTQAAQCHFLTQTAITQQIQALEDSLGFPLINRKKRPIELTAAGAVFYQETKAILARVDEAVAKAQEASKGTEGVIRIGYEKGYERSRLSDHLREFHRAYPNILFTCIREDTDQLAGKLLSDELDVIFSWDSTNLRANPGISSRLDLRSRLSAALYGGHPLAHRKSLGRSELREETILYMSPSGTGDSFGDVHYMQLYEKAGYQPRILLKSNDTESLLIMVAAEEGITILPSHIVDKLTNADNLVFIPLEGEDEVEDVYLLWKTEHSNAALKLFLGFMSQFAPAETAPAQR